jgi:trehalose 6-phosphate synthase
VLHRHLRGEKVIVVANREPYIHEREPDGTVRILHPASGLVTALEPIMRACSGMWGAHGSGSANRETRLDYTKGIEERLLAVERR